LGHAGAIARVGAIEKAVRLAARLLNGDIMVIEPVEPVVGNIRLYLARQPHRAIGS